MDQESKIVILGAGVAGLTAAIALHQKGFEKTTRITMTGRYFAKSLFSEDAKFCKQRNENAKKMDYKKTSQDIAEFWSEHLPN